MKNKNEILSKQLAKMYGDPPIGACSCIGPKSFCFSCPLWWKQLLEDPEQFKAIISAGIKIRDLIL